MRSMSFAVLALLASVVTPLYADTERPTTPTGVSASAVSSSSISVSWNASSDNVGVQGYNIYRNNSYYSTVFNATNFTDNGVTGGSSYNYGVVAFDESRNFTPISITVTATANGADAAPPPSGRSGEKPNPPDGLNAEVQSSNQVKVTWSAAPGNVVGYNIYRNGGYLSTIRSTEYTDSSVSAGQEYRYQVVAFTNIPNFSIKSAELLVNTSNGGTQTAEVSQDLAIASPNNNPIGGGAPEGYRLVFSDEFRGSSLDAGKWNSRYRWGPEWIINNEKQYYVDRINNPDFGHSPFEFDGEHLTISAIPTPDYLKSSAKWQPYLSGALTTYNKFNMRYGYVEMRAKVPRGQGLWPAFWLLHQNNDGKRPEIDVVEVLGDTPDIAFQTYHYYEGWELRSSPTFEARGPDLSQDFHTFAVQWEPGSIVWYVDGEERNRFNDGNVSWEDMYLLVNLATGGWHGDPDGSTPFPARFTIDYIRAYQK